MGGSVILVYSNCRWDRFLVKAQPQTIISCFDLYPLLSLELISLMTFSLYYLPRIFLRVSVWMKGWEKNFLNLDSSAFFSLLSFYRYLNLSAAADKFIYQPALSACLSKKCRKCSFKQSFSAQLDLLFDNLYHNNNHEDLKRQNVEVKNVFGPTGKSERSEIRTGQTK